MKQWLSPRWLIIKLSGLLFAAYSAYNIYVIIRGGSEISMTGIIVSAIVAFAFALLSAYSWTAGATTTNLRFLMIRRKVFIFALLTVLLLKLRIFNRVLEFFSYFDLPSILYGIAYLTTVAALAILLVYFTFIVKKLPYYPKASLILPFCAWLLFGLGLIIEAILFFVFSIGLEISVLRTLVTRPIFYFGFMSLCVHFMIQPKETVELPRSNKYIFLEQSDSIEQTDDLV